MDFNILQNRSLIEVRIGKRVYTRSTFNVPNIHGTWYGENFHSFSEVSPSKYLLPIESLAGLNSLTSFVTVDWG